MKSGRKRRLVARFFAAQDGRCVWCRLPMRLRDGTTAPQRPGDATLEHVISRSEGGSDRVTNLAAACYQCNTSRAAGRKKKRRAG